MLFKLNIELFPLPFPLASSDSFQREYASVHHKFFPFDHVYLDSKAQLALLATPAHCAGKTYIVTGANSGLGFHAALHLAKLGAGRLILAVRNLAAGEEAKARILSAVPDAKTVIEVWSLDLAKYNTIVQFANRAERELERIDGLIENAGVCPGKREIAEGRVSAITVNVVGTLLLLALMLPGMGRKAKKYGEVARLVVVSSSLGFQDWVKGALEGIKGEQGLLAAVDKGEGEYETMKVYALSKLLLTFATRYIARFLVPDPTKSGVIITTVCPGLCDTGLPRYAPPEVQAPALKLIEQCGRTAEDGSRTLLHGTVAGIESHGRFLQHCEEGDDIPDWIRDDVGMQRKIWDDVARDLEDASPGVIDHLLAAAR